MTQLVANFEDCSASIALMAETQAKPKYPMGG